MDKNEIYKNGKSNGLPDPRFDDKEKRDVNEKEITLEVDEEDPWKVTSIEQDYKPWSELNQKEKAKRIAGYLIKSILALGFLYLFICSLDFLSSAFRLLGGEAAGRVFQQNDIMSNPVAGLMMGVLVTVLVQSSSTSTSIIVSMVGSQILDIKTAIPIIMGANIGTSVTNTIVAIGQISDKGEFRRAFAGATVHDMFNWLTVIILLPVEVATEYLYRASTELVKLFNVKTDENAEQDILKKITEPFTKKIIQVNKKAITNIAKDIDTQYDYDSTILKLCCDKPTNDKCCNNQFKSADGGTANRYSFNDAERLSHCQTMSQECLVKRDPTLNTSLNLDTCAVTPWRQEATEFTFEGHYLDCDAFSNKNATTQECCSSKMDAFLLGNDAWNLSNETQAGACAAVESCFAFGNNSFTLSGCESDPLPLMNMTMMREKDAFDCYIWTSSVVNNTCLDKCDYLFRGAHPLGDHAIGAILLVISLGILCFCLVAIVKLLHSLLKGPLAILIKKFVNAEFPGPLKYLTGYVAILVGAGLTIVVQSSSIFTSTMTPLVGIGVIELDRMYPLTLGSNIGTTTTAILSSLTNSGDDLKRTLTVAMSHLLFNITGIIIYYPFKIMRFPIPLAKFLGNTTAKYRWFAIVYIIVMFFLFPLVVFALSIPGWFVLLAVGGPVLILIVAIGILKFLQYKRPWNLPSKLRDFKFLPKPMRSLEPYDATMKKIFRCSRFQEDKEEPPAKNGATNPGYVPDGDVHHSTRL